MSTSTMYVNVRVPILHPWLLTWYRPKLSAALQISRIWTNLAASSYNPPLNCQIHPTFGKYRNLHACSRIMFNICTSSQRNICSPFIERMIVELSKNQYNQFCHNTMLKALSTISLSEILIKLLEIIYNLPLKHAGAIRWKYYAGN